MNRSLAAGLTLLMIAPNSPVAQEDQQIVRPALVASVEIADSQFQRTYSAVVFPSREAELSFRVPGQIIELPIRAGTQVSEGDVVAELDARDFEASVAQAVQQVEQAEAQLQALRSGARTEEIAVLEANVAAAEAQVAQAIDQTERTRELAERGVVSSAQLDQEETNLRVAEANLLVQREQLAIGLAGGRPEDIAAAEASLEAFRLQLVAAEDSLSDASLRAPFDGVIARRDVENFTLISAGQSIALLQTLATVELVFDIPGPDVAVWTGFGTTNVDTKASFDAVPGALIDGELIEFSTQADAATQTYRGRMAVAVPDGATILPGMVGRVIISAESDDRQTLAIPLSSVGSTPNGSPLVWVVEEETNTVSSREVELGDASGDHVTVLSGLAVGETVVSAGVSRMQEGMVVRPITQIGG